MRFKLLNDCARIPDVLEQIEHWLCARQVDKDAVMTASMCLEEVLTNAISYAFTDATTHEIWVDVMLSDASICLKVIDDGSPFNPLEDAPIPDVDAPLEERAVGGLGIYLVRNLMDEVSYSRTDDKNQLILTKHFVSDCGSSPGSANSAGSKDEVD